MPPSNKRPPKSKNNFKSACVLITGNTVFDKIKNSSLCLLLYQPEMTINLDNKSELRESITKYSKYKPMLHVCMYVCRFTSFITTII